MPTQSKKGNRFEGDRLFADEIACLEPASRGEAKYLFPASGLEVELQPRRFRHHIRGPGGIPDDFDGSLRHAVDFGDAALHRRAALAPGNPSSQDRAVAAQASKAEQQAQAELAEQRRETQETQDGGSETPTAPGASQGVSKGIGGYNQPPDTTASQSIPVVSPERSKGSSQTPASLVQAAALASHNARAANAQSTRRGLVDLLA